MSSPLKHLKSFDLSAFSDPAERLKAEQLNGIWSVILATCEAKLLHFSEQAYYRALDHYKVTRRGLPLAHLARIYNKTLARIFIEAGIPHTEIRTVIECLELSKSVPIRTYMTKRGGMLIFPAIAEQTYWNRSMRGERVPELLDVLNGLTDGPELSPAGLALAYGVFDEPAVVTENGTSSESSTDEAKSAERLMFANPALGSSYDMTETSTDQPDTK